MRTLLPLAVVLLSFGFVWAEMGFDEKYDPGNPVNPTNRYAPNNPFNPSNQYNPDNPLNPANCYNPATPFAPLNQPPGRNR